MQNGYFSVHKQNGREITTAVYELCGIAALACLAVDYWRLVDWEYVAVETVRLAVELSRVTVPPRLIISRQTEIYPAYSHLIPRHVKYFG